MPADYKSQRSRIYGSHTSGVNQQKDLPPVEDDHKRVVSAASTVSNNLGGSEYWEHENVRLRGYLKEKDNLIIKLKEENAVLKQSERRHQKEIDALEHRNTEAPMMIKALRNEITGLKQKLKSLYIQQTSDDRNLRYQGEQIRQLKEQKAHLEMLVADQDLQLRDTLTKQLEAARNKMKEKDEEIMDMSRKIELLEKNYTTENKNLRGKLHTMDYENRLVKDKLDKLEEEMRDKEKEVASLEIYRYKALHRKPETCQFCKKRNMEDWLAKRAAQIRGKLPTIQEPVILAVERNALNLQIAFPAQDNSSQYSFIKIKYTHNKDLITDVRKLVLDKWGNEISTIEVDNIEKEKMSNAKKTRTDRSITNDEIEEKHQSEDFTKTIRLEGLKEGGYYYISVLSSHDGVDSENVVYKAVLVDILPPALAKPEVSIESPLALCVGYTAPSHDIESRITSYKIYHATNLLGSSIEVKHLYLLAEIPKVDGDPLKNFEIDTVRRYYFDHPETAVEHYFAVSAVNGIGEGPLSPISDKCVIDFKPATPPVPSVKKYTSSSVQLTIQPPMPNGGSEITEYRIYYANLDAKSRNLEPTEIVVGSSQRRMHIIDNLEPGEKFVFAVKGLNRVGWSDLSSYCEPICLDNMLPIPRPPQYVVLSPTSVVFRFDSTLAYESCPEVIGYKLLMSRDNNMNDVQVVAPLIDRSATAFIVDALEYGRTYYFAMTLLGNGEESGLSPCVGVHLACALPLPLSPAPTPIIQPTSLPEAVRTDTEAEAVLLNRSLSRSIDLTLTQKMTNMYKGQPAFVLPDDIVPAEGETIIVNGAPVVKGRRSITSINGSTEGLAARKERREKDKEDGKDKRSVGGGLKYSTKERSAVKSSTNLSHQNKHRV